MGCGPCCPGKPQSIRIRVGLQEVGIADLERIFDEALAMRDCCDADLRAFLLDRVRSCNYIPRTMESEYSNAIWAAFQAKRSQGGRAGRE